MNEMNFGSLKRIIGWVLVLRADICVLRELGTQPHFYLQGAES